MPTGPGPTGGTFSGPTYAQDPAAFQQEATVLDNKFPGTNVGTQFLTLAQRDPNAPMGYIVAVVLLLESGGQGIGKTVQQAAGGIGNVAQTTGQAIPQSSFLTGINSIGDFFQRLTQPNTWIRVGEIAAGLLILYIGLTALTRGTDAGQAIKTTAKTAKKILK